MKPEHDRVFGDGAPGSAALQRPFLADLLYRVRCAMFRMHDFQVKVGPGRLRLACHHCGKMSEGWEMGQPMGTPPQTATVVKVEPRAVLEAVPIRMARVLPHSPRPQHAAQQQRAAAR